MVLPISDVDRAKQFYSRLGWRLDADRTAGENFRLSCDHNSIRARSDICSWPNEPGPRVCRTALRRS